MAEPALNSKHDTLAPGEALRLLEQREQSSQHELASRTDAGEDVLHYLAEHGAAATRRAVAANPAASPASNRLLADDEEDEVRVELARKIGRLFPGLLLAEKKHLRDLTIETLERLARDEEPRVRAMLAEEIKHLDCVPKDVVQRLAHDAETVVCAPIIEYSPLLSDTDLIEIVAVSHANAMLAAVARRKGLSGEVSDAVVATGDTTVIAILLANIDARLRKKTLDTIISRAAEVAEWHGPLVLRADLSPRAIRRIASFVASALIDLLAARQELDEATRTHLARKLRSRRQQETKTAGKPPASAAAEVEAACRAGKLDDAFVAAAAEAYQKDTVTRALSVLAKTGETTVRRILDSGSAKAVTALCWRAGLSMRIAFKLQNTIMRLKGPDLLPARGGIDFPLSEDEMRWHLGYFGIV
ncbi:MAG TPA: DUF2336 domain-containing protein [Rhizomicrobium sp.]